jgi:hypothetical protein
MRGASASARFPGALACDPQRARRGFLRRSAAHWPSRTSGLLDAWPPRAGSAPRACGETRPRRGRARVGASRSARAWSRLSPNPAVSGRGRIRPRFSSLPLRAARSTCTTGASATGSQQSSLRGSARRSRTAEGKRVEVATIKPYGMRHTYAAWALAAGVNAYTLARRMGMSLETIDKTYGHLARDAEDYERDLLDTFDDALAAGGVARRDLATTS